LPIFIDNSFSFNLLFPAANPCRLFTINSELTLELDNHLLQL